MKVLHLTTRYTRSALRRNTLLRPTTCIQPRSTPSSTSAHTHIRPFSCTRSTFKGLQPDTSDPKPPNVSATTSHTSPTGILHPAELSTEEYHSLADKYLDVLVQKVEASMEDASSGFEVEYSAGVMNITTPQGVYVVNKQPPNKQIWISAPVSGPKRYDWVISGAGQHMKEGTEATQKGDDGVVGGGRWLYLRDGTGLTDLLRDELKIEMNAQEEVEVTASKEGLAGSGVSE